MFSFKAVIYISGGTMQGVFGAGVVTHLQDANAYRYISEMYGSSAGAITAAYFLARQSRIGSSIFYENLTHNFISVTDFFKGVGERIWSHWAGRTMNDLHDAFSIDYLMNILQSGKKRLDIDFLKKQRISLWVKTFNLPKRRVEYLNILPNDTLHVLRASAQLLPYTHDPEPINGSIYMDAGNIEVLGYDYLRQKHPDQKLIFVLNSESIRKLVKHKWKKVIEGKIMAYMHGRDLLWFYKQAEKMLEADIRKISEDPQAILISPPPGSPTLSSTTDPKKLKITYLMGIEAGKTAETFLKEEKSENYVLSTVRAQTMAKA